MWGWVLGAACVVGLVGVARRRRWARRGHCGGAGRGRRGAERRGPGAWRWRYAGHRLTEVVERTLVRRLGLRDEQQPSVAAAVTDLRRALERFGADLGESRTELAKAFDAEKLDQARLTAVWDWQDQSVAELRKDLTAALERLHGALEPEQRRRLVDLLSDDPLRWLVDEV